MTSLIHGDLQINTNTQNVTHAGNLLLLTPKEYIILECFLRNPQRVLTRSAILDKLWNFEQSSGQETIRTHITNLRKKLKEAGGSKNLIETVYGVGYSGVQLSEIHLAPPLPSLGEGVGG